MNWDDLRVFLLVVRRGSILAAAGELGLDHSTVSRRIAGLEARLGARLFDRAGRRLRITPAGERLRASAQRVESIMLGEVAAIAGDEGGIAGCVRIGAPEGLGAGYLGQAMGLICDQHPDLELELVALPQNYSLASREVDIAITLDRPVSGNVSIRKLTDYHLRPYASRAFLAAHGEPAALGGLRSCGYIGGLLHTAELAYRDLPPVLAPAILRSTSILAQRDIVENGYAVGILPCFLASGRAGLVALGGADLTIARAYWISVHDDLRGLARIRAVSGGIVQAVRADATRFLPSPR